MFPKAAAEYVYAKRAFGNELWAFLLGWLIIFAGIVAASTVAIGFAGYLKYFFNAPIFIIGILLIGLLSFSNFVGIQESSRVNILFTGIEIAGLVLIIFLGMGRFPNVNYLEAPAGFQGIFAASALVFFAYLGFEDIVNIAEEMKNPKKIIPRALILSILVTTIFYVLIAISTVSLADWRELGGSDAPLALAASMVLGENAFLTLSVIALFATANTVLILLIVGSRMVYGMARGGSLPNIFSTIHRKRKTPWIAIVAVMLLSMIFTILGDIRLVAGVTNFAAFAIFASVNFSLIWLRYKEPEVERPFKVPFNIGKFPVIPFLGLISCVFLVFHLDQLAIMIGIITLMTGGVAYKILKAHVSKRACATSKLCL
jgi:APA family basic amino acid/polyamine antiporter